MLLSKSDAGTSISQVTWDLTHNTISIPAGKGGWLKRVEIQMCPTRTTVVCAGGYVRLHNSSADWDPFEFTSAGDTAVTEGGGSNGAPVVYEVNKELPGNSDVTSDFRPNSAEVQHIKLTVVWEFGGKPNVETFSKFIYPLYANAVSATARASPGNMQIPGGKGGRIRYIVDIGFGALTTVSNMGGLREFSCDAYDMTPCEKYTTYQTALGASGGGSMRPDITLWDGPCPANATFTTHLTPTAATAQILASGLFWERPIRKTVS